MWMDDGLYGLYGFELFSKRDLVMLDVIKPGGVTTKSLENALPAVRPCLRKLRDMVTSMGKPRFNRPSDNPKCMVPGRGTSESIRSWLIEDPTPKALTVLRQPRKSLRYAQWKNRSPQ